MPGFEILRSFTTKGPVVGAAFAGDAKLSILRSLTTSGPAIGASISTGFFERVGVDVIFRTDVSAKGEALAPRLVQLFTKGEVSIIEEDAL